MESSQGGGSVGARCVLWHARGSLPSDTLLAALDRSKIRWTPWDSDLLALAELLRISVAADPTLPCVLILVEPSRLDGLNGVVATLERFRPTTPVWIFDPARTPHWAQATLEDLRAAAPSGKPEGKPKGRPEGKSVGSPSVVVMTPIGTIVPKSVVAKPAKARAMPTPRAPDSTPNLRLSTDVPTPSVPRAAESEPDDPPPDARSVLTGEEIAMLLSENGPGGESGRKAPAPS